MLRPANQVIKESTPQKIKIEDAIGTTLAHDITAIIPSKYKGPSFRKGHRIAGSDLCHLMRLGKRHVYILDLDKDQVHEDDAVMELATALAGPGVIFSASSKEGKIQLQAAYDGLFKVNINPLFEFNLIPEVMCASIHSNTPVKKNQVLAGTRAIPLVIHRKTLDKAIDIAHTYHPIFSVKLFNSCRARLVITGNEVYDDLIEDRFEAIVRKKLEAYGATLVEVITLPDDQDMIAKKIGEYMDTDTDLIITTGGMSVDPDDVTRSGIKKAGVDRIYYSAAVLPGTMFQIAYKDDLPIAGIPACALYHKNTIFDLVLPRLLAGERPDNHDLAKLAHGGLCLNCSTCRFPACSFGKTEV